MQPVYCDFDRPGLNYLYAAAKHMVLFLYAALIMLFVRTSCRVIHKTLFTCSSDYVCVCVCQILKIKRKTITDMVPFYILTECACQNESLSIVSLHLCLYTKV